MKRLHLALACLLLACSATAATVAERSPFTQGHWWDPGRSGSGFEMFNVGNQVMVIWYTYDDASRPVWYTAQGDLARMGVDSWPLLKHRWADGRKADATQVGTMKVTARSSDAADVAWAIGARVGQWTIQPFVVSGVVNEVDRTGSWFDPTNSGWGLTLTEQGEVLGGVLFTYDAAGAPTWAAGFGRDRGNVELFTFTGPCPGCTYRSPDGRSVGRLGFDFRQEWEMGLRNELTLAMAAGTNVDGARVVQLSRSASARGADRQLANFDSDASLKAFLDAGMLNVRASSSGADFSAAPPMPAYSPTNLIEANVDEAALVKTDGRYIYTFAHNANGVRQPVIRIAQVGDEGGSLAVRGTITLGSGMATPIATAGLFLHGEKLVAVTGTQASAYIAPWYASGAWTRGSTHIEVMSTATPDSPRPVWRAEIQGHHVASRRIGDRLYVVSRFVPFLQGFVYSGSSPTAIAANRTLLAATPLAALLPKVRLNGGGEETMVTASSVYAPPQGLRAPLADMVAITAIDLAAPRIVESVAIIGSVETIYASTSNLFLATSRYEYRSPITLSILPNEPQTYLTDVHQVRLGGSGLAIVGSGSIEGMLGTDADQIPFRMSEHQGRLRAVTSSNTWWMGTKNRVTILEPSAVRPGLLRTVAYMPNAQRPQALGKPGEFLYATRFVGERLYAVTFRQTDPLYVIDLANPADPKITGELQVPGFSEYLHPMANGLLLGFGKDATETGLFQGLQLSLYDVSDAGQPREIQKVLMGKRGSESALLRHHHAFSALPRADGSTAIAIPARIHDGLPQYGTGYYPWQQSGLMRFELRGSGAADSRLVPLPSLITHSASSQPPNYYFADSAQDGGRSILFSNGTVYIGNGQFWRQDSAGNTSGPF